MAGKILLTEGQISQHSFRADIQGLRALAVLAVVLYHFDFKFLPGGYLGVDMFFVISGYLITRNILFAASSSSFSIVTFYIGRLWRIIPASTVTILVTLLIGAMVFPPRLFQDLSESAVWSGSFLANFHFSGSEGYFAPGSGLQPLLHFWSLAVEEQYYIVWPATLILIVKLPKRYRGVAVFLLTIMFLVVSEIWVRRDGVEAYLLSPPRFFEFLAGASVVFLDGFRRKLGTPTHTAVLASSVLMTLAVLLAYQEEWAFPGLAAVPICIATCGLLFSGDRSSISLAYSHEPALFFGKISYSLYLVHWPAVVYYKYVAGENLNLFEQLTLVAASTGVAFALYTFVERPFIAKGVEQRSRETRSYPKIMRFTMVAIGSAIFVPFAFSSVEASDWRLTEAQSQGYQQVNSLRGFGSACDLSDTPPRFLCWFGEVENREPSLVIFGDSHSRRWRQSFETLLVPDGKSGLAATFNGCPPLMGASVVHERLPGWFDFCDKQKSSIFRQVLEEPSIEVVALAARWSFYVRTDRLGESSTKGRVFLAESVDDDLTPARSDEVFKKAVRLSVSELVEAGKTVVLIGQAPNTGYDLDRCLFSPLHSVLADCAQRTREQVRIDLAGTDDVFAQMERDFPGKVFFVDPLDTFCDEVCDVARDGTYMYVDSNHINGVGVNAVFENNRRELEEALAVGGIASR